MDEEAPHRILVIECQPRIDWYSLFRGCTVNGQALAVEQATWHEITLTSYDTGLIVQLDRAAKPLPNSPQGAARTFRPTQVLMRSVTRSVPSQGDSRNLL